MAFGPARLFDTETKTDLTLDVGHCLNLPIKLFEKVQGPEHPDTLLGRNGLAVALNDQGKYAEAEADFRALIKLYEKALGRKPTSDELKLARELAGQPAQPAGVEDLLWALLNTPEFMFKD